MDATHVATHDSMTETRTKALAGGSALEGFGAIAAMALAIVGLVGKLSLTMAAIATIIIGAAAMIEGGAFGLRSARFSAGRFQGSWFEGATGADFQGGLATLVLGILALLGVAPETLLSVAVLALGATFIFSGRLLIGLASVVLGILAVVSATPVTLVLVGILILGAGLLFGGAENAASASAMSRS